MKKCSNCPDTVTKGFAVEKKKWIEGGYFSRKISKDSFASGECSKCEKHYIITEDTENTSIDLVEVVPQSVCLSTCLFDEHGVRIFANDLLVCNKNEDKVYVVVWNGIEFILYPYIENLKYNCDEPHGLSEFKEYLVVGNAFDVAITLFSQDKLKNN